MKPDVVIFDLDDTLVIQEKANKILVTELLKNYLGFFGSSGDREAEKAAEDFLNTAKVAWSALNSEPLCKNLGISAGEGLWGDFTSSGEGMALLRTEALTYRLALWKEILKKYGQDESKAEALRDEFIARRRVNQEWLPGAKELLTYLHGRIKLALLTNGASDLQWFKIKTSGLEAYFDQIVVSGDVGVGKPNPKIYAHLTSAHPQGSRFVMVGNSLNSDIRGATNAGMPCIWLDWEGEKISEDLKPWKIISTLGELPGLLGF